MQVHISTNGTAKMAKSAGKMLKVRQKSNHETHWLGITTTITAFSALIAAAIPFYQRLRNNPKRLMKPVISTLEKTDKGIEKVAEVAKGKIKEMDLEPATRRAVEQSITKIEANVQQTIHEVISEAERITDQLVGASNGSSNGRTGDVQPFGHNAS